MRPAQPLSGFKDPDKSFKGIDPAGAARLISAATDVALLINPEGVIEDLSLRGRELGLDGSDEWVGRRWLDTVTVESQAKVEQLLEDAFENRNPRWRHLNHPASSGEDVPIVYTALGIPEGRRVVAMGRDMRPMAALQRRIIDAQQSMERDYFRLRQAETRYRVLFQEVAEAILIVDASSRRVVEANPAAAELLGDRQDRLVGSVFPRDFDRDGEEAVIGLLAAAREGGDRKRVTARLQGEGVPVIVSASLLLQDDRSHFVVRLRRTEKAPQGSELIDGGPALHEILDRMPDAVVVTDARGAILSVNRAFLGMARIPDEGAVRGESIERWLGTPGVDVPVLVSSVHQRDSVRLFRTTLQDENDVSAEVEVSAVEVAGPKGPCITFSIRNVEQRIEEADGDGDLDAKALLPRSMDQLADLVGRVPLKDLVREATDVVERLCIEAALSTTGDNRASAAEMLGLSRQSLYVKLRRHGFHEPNNNS